MKPHRTVIGAAALSLAVAGSLAGASSARADDVCTTECGGFSPRSAALSGILQKFQTDVMFKYDSAFFKLDTAVSKIELVLYKFDIR